MKKSFCLSALYGVIFLQAVFRLCETVLDDRHVPSPSWPDPALLETAVKFRTSALSESARIKVSGARLWRLAQFRRCFAGTAHLAFRRVQNLARTISISRSTSQRHTVPPLSNTSPDLTTLTAESTESHTFFFGTGGSAGTLYARTRIKWMIGRLVRGLGRERNVVSNMFDRQVTVQGGKCNSEPASVR